MFFVENNCITIQQNGTFLSWCFQFYHENFKFHHLCSTSKWHVIDDGKKPCWTVKFAIRRNMGNPNNIITRDDYCMSLQIWWRVRWTMTQNKRNNGQPGRLYTLGKSFFSPPANALLMVAHRRHHNAWLSKSQSTTICSDWSKQKVDMALHSVQGPTWNMKTMQN